MIVLLLAGCMRAYTMEESESVARDFLITSPTYRFDGSNLKLKDSNSLGCRNCHIFIFEFLSANAGYGDREGKELAQVVTPHISSVMVKDGKVVQAVIDNRWDEIRQRELTDYEKKKVDDSSLIPVYYCAKPRPKECDEGTKPVCSSAKKDFENACKACMSQYTKWYVEGECSRGYVDKVLNDLTQGKITKESGQFLVLVGWNLNEGTI